MLKNAARLKLLSICSALFLLAGAAQAGMIALVTTPGGIGPHGIVNWGGLGPEFTPIVGSATVPVPGFGFDLTVSDTGGFFERRDEGSSWFGNFIPGQNLLWTGEPTGFFANGPVTLSFSSPVQGVGTQIQNTLFGDFRATIAAYDGPDPLGSVLLGEFFVDGTSNGDADGSAPFIGVLSGGLNIRSVVLSTSVLIIDQGFQPANDFAINDVLVSTPEPSAFLLLGTGLAALLIGRRYRK